MRRAIACLALVGAAGIAAGSPQVAFTGGKVGVPAAIGVVGGGATGGAPVPPSSSKNVGVSEKVLDGHVDDVVWATKDGLTMFLVRLLEL